LTSPGENRVLPKALLLDLDDTILNDSMNTEDCWEVVCDGCADDWRGLDRAELLAAIGRARDWYWADPDRHRQGRLDLVAARTEIVRLALAGMNVDRPGLAERIGAEYCALREARMHPIPGAIETVRWLRDQTPCRLALLTNGSRDAQRRKLERFAIADLFDHVLIEGEMGFGKPDPRAFERALGAVETPPEETWMVGDNLHWDVGQAQRMGMRGVWVDGRRRGLPPDCPVQPHLIVRSISELRNIIDGGEVE
jgi:putative hydrolase of the HAD superfamily